MLTRRENYTRILTRGNGDRLPFVPNFDYWYRVNRANGRIPEAYAGLSRNDLVRAVGATLWVRTNVLEPVLDPTVEVTERDDGRRRRTEYRTPVGTVSTLHEYADDSARTCYLMEHRIKRAEDIPVVKYLFEHTSLKADFTSFLESEAEVGEDGISLVGLPFCFPYIHFAKQEAGYQAGIYLYADYPELVEELMEVIARVNLAGAELLASGPALVVQQGDNMDEWTTPPNLFKRLAVPYFRRVAEILHRAGKIYQGHWCGRTEHLLPLVPGSGLDVIEAVSVAPMARLTIPEALEAVGPEVVIQGGVPSVLMCPQGGDRRDLAAYIKDLLPRVPHGNLFALGMSDNVPSDADFDRVKIVADLVNNYRPA